MTFRTDRDPEHTSMNQMDRPKSVSVITVVLNNAAGFEKTRQSIFEQDYPDLEWIVVDGGSDDGTLAEIRKHESRITHLISEPDHGIYDAMNKGLAKATGEWVNFMNAGDTFAYSHTVSAVMAAYLEGVGVVYGDHIAAYPKAKVLRRADAPEEMTRGMVFCHQAAFVRRELAMAKGFDLLYPVGADFDMMFRLLSEDCIFNHLPIPVAVIDVSGVSNRKMAQSAREHFAILKKCRKLTLPEQMYHYTYICWVSMVSAGYKILPASLMHRISNIISKSNKVRSWSPPPPPLPGERGPGGEVIKILLLNTNDLRGGAARATWRLFEGLKFTGNEVNMLVQERRSDDPSVIIAQGPGSAFLNPLRPYIDFAIPFLQVRKRVLFSSSLIPDRIVQEIDRINPDVVHLNWITGGFVRIESLAKIIRPVIWTLHDMWAFTGGCHYTAECTRYLNGCGNCPVLHSSRENDLSRRVFNRKQATYGAMKNLFITTPSHWLAQKVSESPLLKNRRVEVIPNGLDTGVYTPSDQMKSRQKLGLPPGKKLILFGAIRGVNNPAKGFDLLLEALSRLSPEKYELLVFGSDRSAVVDQLKLRSHFFGHIAEEHKLVMLYAAADIIAVPSRQEVFGQAASEAMACGRPVVAFACGGLTDIVKHRETGYLAKPFEPKEFAEGIEWIVADEDRYQRLCAASRARTVEKFDAGVVAERMLQLYRKSVVQIEKNP